MGKKSNPVHEVSFYERSDNLEEILICRWLILLDCNGMDGVLWKFKLMSKTVDLALD